MKTKNSTSGGKYTHWLSVIVIGIALGLGLQFVRAWTEPTQARPNGNVGAPINTSSNEQSKAGKIKAQDFCLNDNSKCLSTISGTPAPWPQLYQCPNASGHCGGTCDGRLQVAPTCVGYSTVTADTGIVCYFLGSFSCTPI